MPMQQMALMAYSAGVAGGGSDSAYLQQMVGSDGASSITLEMNNFGAGGIGYLKMFGMGEMYSYQWKTGPYAASEYECKYIEEVVGGTGGVTGSSAGVWYNLGTLNTPSWVSELGIGNSTDGFLVIRNASTLVELANVAVSIVADPST